MIRAEAIFEIAYRAGIGHYEIASDDSLSDMERAQNLHSAVYRLEEALNSGRAAEAEDEFDCRTRLAIVLVHLNYRNNAQISAQGLSESLEKAVIQLEKALGLNAGNDGKFLADRRVAATVLLQLDTLWMSQSAYLYKRFGALIALNYLHDKIKMLEYLGDINLPGVSATLFHYWAESRSPGIAFDWLKRAATGETFEDVAKGTRFCSASLQYKTSAQQMLAQWSS